MTKSEKKTYPFWHVSPNILILGAGASKAAFPNGDKHGRKLPLMNDLVEILDLGDKLTKHGIVHKDKNFEKIYDDLYKTQSHPNLLKYIKDSVWDYFSKFEIPDEVTIYDELILSLRKKDFIYSFNWDPLLLQAYRRHSSIKNLPSIHFLHGNVAVGICEKDKTVGFIQNPCSKCKRPFSPVPLLYPVSSKNYDSDSFIRDEWRSLRRNLEISFILTIFGYSAPKTDVIAKEMMEKAWDINSRKRFNEVQIIDIKSEDELHKTWADFIVSHHYKCWKSIHDSMIYRYPRRSCTALGESIMQLDPWHDNYLPKFSDIENLQNWFKPLIEQEENFEQTGEPLVDIQK